MVQKKITKFTFFSFFFLVFWSGTAAAHAPVFMMAPEAPGKDAFDLHTSLTTGSQGSQRATEAELEFAYGVTRDLSVGFAVPFTRNEQFTDGMRQTSLQGVENPKIAIQWRFWNRDTLGAKHSSAIRLTGTAPVGDKSVARNRPAYMFGWAYGMESIKWYYTLDLRYQYEAEDKSSKPGDKFFADVAIGLRPHLAGLEDTDTVFFVEFNYINKQNSTMNGLDNPDSGGDFMFISPEILISPGNRVMIRGGAQIPFYQETNGIQEPENVTYKFIVELRF